MIWLKTIIDYDIQALDHTKEDFWDNWYIPQGRGAARVPKPGKTPIMAAHRHFPLQFLKIKVRPRSCRSYHICVNPEF